MHVARYLADDQDGSDPSVRDELEEMLRVLQPGWEQRVVSADFLPSMTVTANCPEARSGGLAGRPPVVCAGADGLFLAGDWVGHECMLADASFASARRAAAHVVSRLAHPKPVGA